MAIKIQVSNKILHKPFIWLVRCLLLNPTSELEVRHRKNKTGKIVYWHLMGCLKLSYRKTESPLKVVHRSFSSEGKSCAGYYRYGFNGKEKDQDGEFGMNHYDYGFRIYNPAIAKFLSVDPLTKSYPMLTPYQFASNTPIQAIDLDGLELLDYRSMWDIEIVSLPKMGIFYFGKHASNRTTLPKYHKKNNQSIGEPQIGQRIHGKLVPPRQNDEVLYDPTPNIFNDGRVSMTKADRTKSKIIDFYATDKQAKYLTGAGLVAKAIKGGSILAMDWMNAEKDDALYDLDVNSGALQTALNLVYDALDNTDQEALNDVYKHFEKDEINVIKDLSMYVVDGSVSGDKEYKKYIRDTGDKILDSYRGSKRQKRKSKVGTKNDVK